MPRLDQEGFIAHEKFDWLYNAARMGKIASHRQTIVNHLLWMCRHAISSDICRTSAHRPREKSDGPGDQGGILPAAANRTIDVFADQVDCPIRDAELQLYIWILRLKIRKRGN